MRRNSSQGLSLDVTHSFPGYRSRRQESAFCTLRTIWYDDEQADGGVDRIFALAALSKLSPYLWQYTFRNPAVGFASAYRMVAQLGGESATGSATCTVALGSTLQSWGSTSSMQRSDEYIFTLPSLPYRITFFVEDRHAVYRGRGTMWGRQTGPGTHRRKKVISTE